MIYVAAGQLELICADCGRPIIVEPSEGRLVSFTDVVVAENDHITTHIVEGHPLTADRS